MRKKIVAGNWKMNKIQSEVIELTTALSLALQKHELAENHEVIICPSLVYLSKVNDILALLADKKIKVGSQNCHTKNFGAYTGEVSAAMLKSLKVQYVLVGHSERRTYFGEDNSVIKAKLDIALAQGLQVIFCCGESLNIRESKAHFDFIATQLEESLFHLTKEELQNVVLAYEPIWAIGTGVTASPEQAEEIHAHIRALLSKKYDEATAENMTILYGGSCKPTNAAQLFSQPNVDGGLIGGASLKADSFMGIIKHL
ncbi:MAG: triose-phosphate isomerase [Chitinophagales bacterium]